jgi:poly(A) polymerase Pap1
MATSTAETGYTIDGAPKPARPALGVTDPISLVGPTDSDRAASTELERCLREYDLLESEQAQQKRSDILGALNVQLQEWVKEQSHKRLPAHIAEHTKGKIFTFGSYRLGVYTKGKEGRICESVNLSPSYDDCLTSSLLCMLEGFENLRILFMNSLSPCPER